MKNILLFYLMVVSITYSVNAQEVGIGTTTPNSQAILHIDVGASTTKGLLITGTSFTGTVPDLGGGARLMFFPGKAAFRAGYIGTTEWNNVNTGYASVAMGESTIASAHHAFAMGLNCTASGFYSFAVGNGSTANGQYSTALGFSANAQGSSSFAEGFICSTFGQASVAMGSDATASGDMSVAIGTNISTNSKTGSFFFADSDPHLKGVRVIGSADQMACRFNGGYYFISSNAGADIGVQVLAGSNSWSVISDVKLKENFMPVDEESFLKKIAKLNLTTWNYKTQDPKIFRHYGPMAQDFYKAFGKDGLGTIGCDTLINQQDFLGVNLIAIQGLEKRTQALMDENKELKVENREQKIEMEELKTRLERIERLLGK